MKTHKTIPQFHCFLGDRFGWHILVVILEPSDLMLQCECVTLWAHCSFGFLGLSFPHSHPKDYLYLFPDLFPLFSGFHVSLFVGLFPCFGRTHACMASWEVIHQSTLFETYMSEKVLILPLLLIDSFQA